VDIDDSRGDLRELERTHPHLKVLWREVANFQSIHLVKPTQEVELVNAIFAACDWRRFTYFLRRRRIYTCFNAALLPDRMSALGHDYPDHDGVALHSNPNLPVELEELLAQQHPLQACRYCLGSSGPVFEHRLLRGRSTINEAKHCPDGSEHLAHVLVQLATRTTRRES
jgi:hypothetical protein